MTLTAGFFVRTALVLLTALVLQPAFFDWHQVASVPVSVFLALAVAGGLTGGSQRGAILGFAGGCAADLLITAPFGLSALSMSLVGYCVGSANSLRVRQSRVFTVPSNTDSGYIMIPCSTLWIAFLSSGESS